MYTYVDRQCQYIILNQIKTYYLIVCQITFYFTT